MIIKKYLLSTSFKHHEKRNKLSMKRKKNLELYKTQFTYHRAHPNIKFTRAVSSYNPRACTNI
eukprot:snap_masked-scaffold_13-processed-gene-6.16-mRNA-1 protein AED:1.00 eAED:1.00 QI:0/0/0/0/1/1/2/0/62